LALRGSIDLESGNNAEAERWLRDALKQKPSEVDVLNNLERSLNNQGKKAEAKEIQNRREASEKDQAELSDLMKEIAKNPADPEPRRQVAIRLIRNGFDMEAKRWLEVAIRQNPRHAPSYETMATYYDKIGDLPAAAECRARAKLLAAKPK